MEENENYYCYSFRLYHFLRAFSEKCMDSQIHQKTQRRYWVFHKSERLDRLIAAYNSMKHDF